MRAGLRVAVDEIVNETNMLMKSWRIGAADSEPLLEGRDIPPKARPHSQAEVAASWQLHCP